MHIIALFKMPPRPRRPKQLSLSFRSWGGARHGAGRKPSRSPAVPHRARPAHAPQHPVHVTLRVSRLLPKLRSERCTQALRRAFARGKDRLGIRLVHYAIQNAHVHLVLEADSRRALSRGLQGLLIRMARGLNKTLGRSGRVFADRYHQRALRTPREVRHALAYVLLQDRHHAAERGLPLPPARRLDPSSSAPCFEGWRREPRPSPADTAARETVQSSVTAARTWLLTVGWLRHGRIDPAEVPGRTRRRKDSAR